MPIDTQPINSVDLIFRAMGQAIPRNHAYSLMGAISRVIPWLHGDEAKRQRVGLFPVRGTPAGDGRLLLNDHSAVRIRLPAGHLPAFLPLAGKQLELDGCRLRLGVPSVAALVPATALSSSLVLIKLAHATGKDSVTPESFMASAKKQLTDLNIAAEPGLQVIKEGPRTGEPRRRVMKVKGQTHVGYAMIVQGLTAAESIRLQEHGLGGRRTMGCGLFFAGKGEVMSTINRTKPILAKSVQSGRDPVTIGDHTQDVMESATALFGTEDQPTTLANRWGEFFGLSATAVRQFIRTTRLAAYCHDWGKANDGFQNILAHRGTQLLRHEQISVLIMCLPSVWKWLAASGLDIHVVLAAVLGHHLKARDVDLAKPEAEADQFLRLRWDETDFHAYLKAAAPSVGLSPAVPTDVPSVCSFGGERKTVDLDSLFDSVQDRLDELDSALRQSDEASRARTRLLWSVRAALVAADSAGSGLVRTGEKIEQWIGECMRFDHPTASPDGLMTGDTIRQSIITDWLKQNKLSESQLNDFQKACKNGEIVPSRSLLLAPCGSGKTAAAWLWIAARLDERPRGRAIFLYPTRGTATEGYRAYAAFAGPKMAALVHGTADLDIDLIHKDIPTERRLADARLFALRQWPKRIFSATVDQFLGFMQHGYGPTCQLPLLADSVLVLDEVHSYDRGMWSALKAFLEHFPTVPVLCMTATLLDRRINELHAMGMKVVDGLKIGGGDGSDLVLAAQYPRYHVRQAAGSEEARKYVEQALAKGQRVLWVVNTVDRCQELARSFAQDIKAETLQTRDGLPLYCYHSRYRLADRRKIHDAVVEAFRKKDTADLRPVLAITTQVCEMSLDLDADLLVTELCPATALVQRFGRCCRDQNAHKTGRVAGEVIVYDPPELLPYTKGDMAGVSMVIENILKIGTVSQEALAALLDKVSPPIELPKACRFIDSGVWAAAGEEQFRDTDDISRQALHDDDVDEYARLIDPKLRGNDPPWKADELLLSLPKKYTQDHGEVKSRRIPQWLKLAQGGTYYRALGYCGGDIPLPH